MSRPKSNAEWTCNVFAKQFQVATKILVGDSNQGRDQEFMSRHKFKQLGQEHR